MGCWCNCKKMWDVINLNSNNGERILPGVFYSWKCYSSISLTDLDACRWTIFQSSFSLTKNNCSPVQRTLPFTQMKCNYCSMIIELNEYGTSPTSSSIFYLKTLNPLVGELAIYRNVVYGYWHLLPGKYLEFGCWWIRKNRREVFDWTPTMS